MIGNIIGLVAKITLVVVAVCVAVRICKKVICFIIALRKAIDEMFKKNIS